MKTLTIFGLLTMIVFSGCTRKSLSSLASEPGRASFAGSLKILSYNTYLLKSRGLRSYVDTRYKLLPQALRATGADIIVLQEAWTREDFDPKKDLVEVLKDVYPFSAAYEPGADDPMYTKMGNGLLILSKFPVFRITSFEPWKNFTRKAETVSRKGILKTVVHLDGYGDVQVFAVHTSTKQFVCDQKRTNASGIGIQEFCQYKKEDVEERIKQLNLLKAFMQASRTNDIKAQFLAVDINSHHSRWEKGHEEEIEPDFGVMFESSDPQSALESAFDWRANRQAVTWNPENFWVKTGLFPHVPPSLFDYVFYTKAAVRQASAQIVLTEKHQLVSRYFKPFSAELADHYGVLATFEGFSGFAH